MAKRFKQEVLDQIEKNPALFSKVCDELKMKPTSLPNTLRRNGTTLNQYSIVKLVADHLSVDPDSLLEDENSEEVDKVSVSQS